MPTLLILSSQFFLTVVNYHGISFTCTKVLLYCVSLQKIMYLCKNKESTVLKQAEHAHCSVQQFIETTHLQRGNEHRFVKEKIGISNQQD